MPKRRSSSAAAEKAGLLAVEKACNDHDLIWRDLLQEDVGVDGTIEVCLGDFPTGKIVGAQVKSGMSYVNADRPDQFKFYARPADLEYWLQMSIHLFLFVYHPEDDEVYWHHVTNYVPDDEGQASSSTHIVISKSNKVDKAFASYLVTLFALEVYDADRLTLLSNEMAASTITVGHGAAAVTISALDLFVGGLWGLCSKVQFHASILLQRIRKQVVSRGKDTSIAYTLSRGDIYPFIVKYIRLLTDHGIAKIDIDDINDSLYRKMEQPTFIAPLTTNGRALVDFLRTREHADVHDNQYFTLSLIPAVQIEVYANFDESKGMEAFGPYTDVFAIRFNQYLDYYEIQHFARGENEGSTQVRASQIMYFNEMTEYLDRTIGNIPKDQILLRYLDHPCTPLVAWLEDWYDDKKPFHIDDLAQKSNGDQVGFHDEMISIMSGVGTISAHEPPLPGVPIRKLVNGEILDVGITAKSGH
ncbi:DUF4365 domain-containing protein [Tritonibacter scottomollicae]|uniref:DUF4365 domain-containing protein n=1 Tax=Tritonibacter scottomollicae TaxID=483013 RepID=A0ABZ0HIT5_TRISK|nr:DUF4365 domain-containing protein [Tritonibacter scottomollicae]WOI34191.1 DUF4365 domain-containing protein [Tritonibacter scottomollicae]